MSLHHLLTALIVLSALHPAIAQQPRLTASFHDDGVTIQEGKLPVLSYQARSRSLDGTLSRANYVHPLHDLSGEVITEDFPDDHRHHRGIFWAWHQVWVDDTRLGDSWACRDFQWDVQSVSANTPGDPLVVSAVVLWKSPDLLDAAKQPAAVVEEQTQIIVNAAQQDHRVIDFRISLLALVDGVRIGGSEDEKGYGGFSPRIRLTGHEQFLSDSGSIEPSNEAITAGPWVNLTREHSGIVILVHRDNPQTTEQNAKWILRRSRSMQNAVYPGRDAVAISNTTPTVLRYRLVVHDGTLSSAAIGEQQAEFWKSR